MVGEERLPFHGNHERVRGGPPLLARELDHARCEPGIIDSGALGTTPRRIELGRFVRAIRSNEDAKERRAGPRMSRLDFAPEDSFRLMSISQALERARGLLDGVGRSARWRIAGGGSRKREKRGERDAEPSARRAASAKPATRHSHSIVPGGFDVTS